MDDRAWERPVESAMDPRRDDRSGAHLGAMIDAETAAELNDLAGSFWQEGDLAAAERLYQRAHQLNPSDPAILSNLGNVCWAQRRTRDAKVWYQRALQLRPSVAEVWMNLGVVLSDEGEYDDAETSIRRAIGLRPDFADAHHNLGMTLGRQGKLDEALAAYENALRLRPDYAEAHRNRGMIYLTRGEFARGWSEYEWRLRCWGSQNRPLDRPRWAGEPLDGRTILLHAEQGLGDTIQFVRFAPLVEDRGGRVVLLCASTLVPLLEKAEGIDRVIEHEAELPEFDAHAPLMSLPAILETTLENLPSHVPYLHPSGERAARWHSIRDESARPHVGICWQGNPQHQADRRRSFRLEELAALGPVRNVRWINLQVGAGREQLAEVAGRFAVDDPFGAAGTRDFADTAALVAQLDLVITADTAVAHLAGALGVAVWVALPHVADWRWLLDREDCPWYPTMRLFRQPAPGDWGAVFRQVAAALQAWETARR